MSASRVEYDAALKRVEVRARARGLRLHEASLADLTLAALGLDEPPTEESWSSGTGGLNADWSRPPAEPPKACPTCERDEYRRAIRSALDAMENLTDEELGPGGGARRAYAGLWHAYHAVPAGIPTGGSGVDGGTA